MPWVRVAHLASHILGRMARMLSADWQRLYAHPIYFVETFIDPQRFGHLLPGGQLDGDGADHGSRQGCAHAGREPLDQAGAGLCPGQGLSPAAVAGGRLPLPLPIAA